MGVMMLRAFGPLGAEAERHNHQRGVIRQNLPCDMLRSRDYWVIRQLFSPDWKPLLDLV